MYALIVNCHPEPKSFNGALTERARDSLTAEGWNVVVSNLYGEAFDPVERAENYTHREQQDVFAPLGEQRHAWQNHALPDDVTREIARLEQADLVIFQFPLWWHSVPAILKGWFDRVFVSGGLYSSRKRYDAGHFRGKRAVCSVTTGAPAKAFGPGARGGDLETMLWPVEYSLHYMGFSVLPRFVSFGVQGNGYAYQGEESLKVHLSDTLDAWSAHVLTLPGATPLIFPGWADWDADGAPLTNRA